MSEEYEAKLIVLGESTVGKTSLISSLLNKNFEENGTTTVGAEFQNHVFKMSDGKTVRLKINDTAGQERFRALNRVYIQNSKIVLLVYSIADRDSFEQLKEFWIGYVREHIGSEQYILYVIGNKQDLYLNENIVDDEEGKKFAESIGAFFKLTSAKRIEEVEKLFNEIAETFRKKVDSNEITSEISNGNQTLEVKKKERKTFC